MNSKERWQRKFNALCACNSHMNLWNAKTATNCSVNIARSSFSSPMTSPNWSLTTRMSTPTQNNSNFLKMCSQRCHQGREKLTLLKCRLDNNLNSSDLENPELLQDMTFAAHIARLEVTFCNQLIRFSRTAYMLKKNSDNKTPTKLRQNSDKTPTKLRQNSDKILNSKKKLFKDT